MIWPFAPVDRRIADLKRQRNFALTENTRLRAENANYRNANDQLRVLIDRHKAIAERYKADAEREKRLRVAHEGQCPTAAAIADHDSDKARSNRE